MDRIRKIMNSKRKIFPDQEISNTSHNKMLQDDVVRVRKGFKVIF